MKKIPERVLQTRAAWAANDARRDAGLTEPEELEKYRDISYGPHGSWNLMDIYTPKRSGAESFPTIVNIHGGGFFYGDKELYRFYCMHLAELGFAVVNFNYRLSPENAFPAPLEDTLAVFAFISKNADRYGLDISHVFLTGDSAGAQLASQFACICSNSEYAKIFGFDLPKNVQLRAVSLACGMYSLRDRPRSGEGSETIMDYFQDESLFDDPRTEILENITADYPPAFVFSAQNDFLVDACEPMAEYLISKGVSAESRIYGSKDDPLAAHVFHCNLRYTEGIKANQDQADFFKRFL
ncbi:MAG: alpha/beta hydrolase [Lachnospiraceae bacterium]|nr:alpha/beta hydrolase [Lachnospiraceae bacterium]